MKRFVWLFLYGSLSVSANTPANSPVYLNTKEGQSIYTPIPPPVNPQEEARIQLNDQNSSRKGSR